jgi:hypothetical protein
VAATPESAPEAIGISIRAPAAQLSPAKVKHYKCSCRWLILVSFIFRYLRLPSEHKEEQLIEENWALRK